jgi:uncharacterized membrane protein
MTTDRLEAFSDRVLAIIITIMVLELKVPELTGIAGLKPLLPLFCSYLLSFIYIGIYWNNHHHMFHLTKRVNGAIMWANLHLLFWLSLFPFATAWVGKNHLSSFSVALYGFVALMAGCSFYILQWTIIFEQGAHSALAIALGKDCKGKISILCYLLSIPFAFASTWISTGLFVFVAFLWLVPDRRIENFLVTHSS